MKREWKQRLLIIGFFSIFLFGSMIILVNALDTELNPNGCDHEGTGACSISNINSYDANYETLNKNEHWIISYTDLSCDSINSAKVCLDIWAQNVPSGETVTFECSVDGSNWNKCGTNTWTPADSKTTYCYEIIGVTCSDINDFTSRLTSNDAKGPDNFYLDYTNITIDYTSSADTCTYISGTWEVDCSDNCVIDSPVDLGGDDIIISGTGTFTMTADVSNYGIVTIKGTDSANKCIVTCLGGCLKN